MNAAVDDRAFRVSWKAGKIVVHAATPEKAIAIAVEYLRVADAGRLRAEPAAQEIEVQP